MNRDPIGEQDDLNLYAMVAGDPVNKIDPNGEFGLWGALIGGGLDLGLQLAMNGGNWKCVKWWRVGLAGALGAVGGGYYSGAFKHAVSGKRWTKMSRKWKAVSSRYRKVQTRAGNTPNEKWEAHHWFFPRNGNNGASWRHHPANLMPIPRGIHQRIHGNHPRLDKFNILQRWHHGTPSWAKGVQASATGGTAGSVVSSGSCGC